MALIFSIIIFLLIKISVDEDKLQIICRKLKISHAVACVGFDRIGNRWRPKFRGVVVCAENAERVMEEWDKAFGFNPFEYVDLT